MLVKKKLTFGNPLLDDELICIDNYMRKLYSAYFKSVLRWTMQWRNQCKNNGEFPYLEKDVAL